MTTDSYSTKHGRRAGAGLSRRRFVRQVLAGGAAVAVPRLVPSRALGLAEVAAPSERITLGVIGFGPRCRHVLGCMLPEPDVQCVALCDVQAARRTQGKAVVDGHYGNADCTLYRDLRELLARVDIDAVLVATGDRWHTPASIRAARAGKDVYSEKPCAINIAECRELAEAMRRYGTVYQAGTQRRSIENFQVAVGLARSGKLGKLRTLHASVYTPRMLLDWLPAEPEPPKDVVDWDMWLGPSPWRPYNSAYVNGRWRGYPDFESGATLLDWGAHTVDLCQWAAGANHTAPIEYAPSEANIIARYADGVEVVMGFLATPFGDRSPHWPNQLGTCPVRFVGEEGSVETGDSGEILVSPESLKSELGDAGSRRQGTDAGTHVRNFFDCVKSRARTNCDAETTRHSHLACYAAANAWMLGRKLTLDPAREEFPGDDEANRMRSRAAREPWGV